MIKIAVGEEKMEIACGLTAQSIDRVSRYEGERDSIKAIAANQIAMETGPAQMDFAPCTRSTRSRATTSASSGRARVVALREGAPGSTAAKWEAKARASPHGERARAKDHSTLTIRRRGKGVRRVRFHTQGRARRPGRRQVQWPVPRLWRVGARAAEGPRVLKRFYVVADGHMGPRSTPDAQGTPAPAMRASACAKMHAARRM